jgi:PEP-CTERM motif
MSLKLSSALTMGAIVALTTPAAAGNLISNGGFETGDFTGWTTNVQAGSEGNLFVVPNNGGTTPLSGHSYAVNPTGGNFFALTDQGGRGSYSLTQSFSLGSAENVTVTFDLFANDWADLTAPGRDFNTVTPTQNAEVDILTGGANPFTDGPGIVATLYGPGADNFADNPNPWTDYSSTLSLGAGTYEIRFAETDNQGFFNMGVDNVSVSMAIPEPSTWCMVVIGFAAFGLIGWKRTRKVFVAEEA